MAVTVDQLRNLADRAGHGLTPDEQARLRAGIDRLASATESEFRRQLADAIAALGKAETELAGVRALCDRWVKAGPPPLGQSISRWWDRRLAELGATLNTRPSDDTPPVHHLGGQANAEDCPACTTATVPPPYPWICPGPAATEAGRWLLAGSRDLAIPDPEPSDPTQCDGA